jgi:hypothetical protein
MKSVRSARPIRNKEIASHYNSHNHSEVSLSDYTSCWREWIQCSEHKTLIGLENFFYSDYTAGTSQTFDHFVLKHSDKNIMVLRGDFQYHACIVKSNQFKYIDYTTNNNLHDTIIGSNLGALIISLPFSDLGTTHPAFNNILTLCNLVQIPVCLDLAYWGISKNIHLDLNKFPCIREVTSSLSKPFFSLENHRVGVRFSREYLDDGISMLNDVGMQNMHSMSLGMHFMKEFDPDWNWKTFERKYTQICNDQQLTQTDTVIFGLGDKDRHSEHNRGIPNNYRVCISEFLSDCEQ